MSFGKLNIFNPNVALTAGFIALVSLSVARIHLRVQTTLIGYEIGHMKADEARLLEDRSLLNMQLAKITSRKNLQLIVDTEDTDRKETASQRSSFASNQ